MKNYFPDSNQDLIASIVHRGRDHGLPTYKQVRESCGLTPIASFEELNNTLEVEAIESLKRIYQVTLKALEISLATLG